MNLDEKIEAFLASGPYAVVGASRDREKYGNKVLRCYRQHDLTAYPVNLNQSEIEGLICYPRLDALPERVERVSIITPPVITEGIVEEAAAAGVGHLWMQPGAESPEAVTRAESLGLSVITGGPCILVTLGYSEA